MAHKVGFREMLKRSLMLDRDDAQLYDKLPNDIFEGIFQHNFNGNLNTAERVLFNRYGKLQKIETEKLEREKRKIENLSKAAKKIVEAVNSNRSVLFVTDADNDGSLSQSILIEYLKILPEDKKNLVHIEYAQPIGKSHGITYEIIEKATEFRDWKEDTSFLIVTADNGINNRDEQARIQEKWKNTDMIVTDHHLPDADSVVIENDRTIIFNPKNKPTDYFKNKNISGANVLGVLLTETYNLLTPDVKEPNYSQEVKTSLANMRELGYWANYLDYANADLADMPTRPYIIDKASSLSPTLNVSNSMANFVTGNFTDELLEKVQTASNGAIEKEWLKDQIEDVAALNLLSHKMLNIYVQKQEYIAMRSKMSPLDLEESDEPELYKDNFYHYLAVEMDKEDMSQSEYKSINNNYIQQLRPIVFNLSAIDNKDKFDTELAKNMVDVFETLRKKERILLDKARQVDLLVREELENSAISYPIDADLPKVFNRKFLGKAYNEANNGFNLIVDKVSEQGVSGSMRTLYPITQILEGKEKIEEKLGVTMSFKGHEQAAGFFIDAKDEKTKVTSETVKEINQWLNERVAVLKANELNPIRTVEVDFASVSLVDQINSSVKAQLAGMKGIPTIIRFSPNDNNEVFVTDPKTTEQISLKDMIGNKKYGYQSIKTDLSEGAFIAPVEMLRKVIDGGYKDALKLAYLGQGAFIAQQVTDPSKMSNLFSLTAPSRDQEKLKAYYKENFSETNFMDLDRDYFKNLPYFKYNKFGEREFNNWESVIIKMLDKTHQDVLAVVDTEGTGLGKAPHCLNIGGTNIMIDEKSGEKIETEDFAKRYFKTSNGYDVLLNDEQLSSLIRVGDEYEEESIEEASDFDNKKMTVLYVVERDGLSESYIYPGNYKELKQISNMKFVREAVEFDTSKVYTNEDGESYELTDEQIASLTEISASDVGEDEDMHDGMVLYGETRFGEAYVYKGDVEDLKYVDIIEEDEKPIKEVIINREVKGSAFAMLIKGDDFAIPKEFEKLTGISQGMLNELGMTRDKADDLMTDYYANMKNADGESAKVIFQAHNMPYDKGVVSANFDKFNEFMNNHVISDTAKIARSDKLAYDDTPVCSFEGIAGIPPRVYFYDSPYSDYSMTTFLERIKTEKKGGVFPDTTARYLLRYSMENEKFSLIDRKSKEEFILEDANLENMSANIFDEEGNRNENGCKDIGQLPNNALKYSVERMSSRAMIRNIILSQDFKVQRVQLDKTEKLFANSLNYFQDNYHFDSSVKTNIKNFQASMSNDSNLPELLESVDMEKFTERFLKLNKKTQAMFHDGWIYEKVLAQYEPTKKDINVTNNVLEQINYLTDVPKDRIKEVLKSVVLFKREHNIDHALVHEQHNNIIQKSEDGMGLSDTAYECVLPQHLSVMKHYNSYQLSNDLAANRMIGKNLIGSMVQTVLKNNNDETFSMDSYSIKQMLTYSGENKTKLVQKAQDYVQGLHMVAEEGQEAKTQEIKFKLSSGVLPPYSAVYGKTGKHIEQDKIYEYSEKLNFVLMNEQIGFAAETLVGMAPSAKNGIVKIVSENFDKTSQYKKEIQEDFGFVEFERRDELRKKIASGLMDALETGKFEVKARAVVTPEIVKETEYFAREFAAAIKRVLPDSDLIGVLESAVQTVKEAEEIQKEKAAKAALKASKATAKKAKTSDEVVEEKVKEEVEFKSVRDENFLPHLKIERREPLKVLLDNGLEFTFAYMKKILKSPVEKVLENSNEIEKEVKPVEVEKSIVAEIPVEEVGKNTGIVKKTRKRKP